MKEGTRAQRREEGEPPFNPFKVSIPYPVGYFPVARPEWSNTANVVELWRNAAIINAPCPTSHLTAAERTASAAIFILPHCFSTDTTSANKQTFVLLTRPNNSKLCEYCRYRCV